jgi:hypothetical protein
MVLMGLGQAGYLGKKIAEIETRAKRTHTEVIG